MCFLLESIVLGERAPHPHGNMIFDVWALRFLVVLVFTFHVSLSEL